MAEEGITKSHYVDDYWDRLDTVEEARRVATEVKMIRRKGGFKICGRRSNSAWEKLIHLRDGSDDVRSTIRQQLFSGEDSRYAVTINGGPAVIFNANAEGHSCDRR